MSLHSYYAQDISRVFSVKFNSFKNYIGVNLDTYIVVMFLDIEFNIVGKTYFSN